MLARERVASCHGSPVSVSSPSAAAGSSSRPGSPRWSPSSRSSAALGGAWSADYTTPGSDSKRAAERSTSASRRARRTRSTSSGGTGGRGTRAEGFLREAATLPGIGARRRAARSRRTGTVAVARLPLTMPPGEVPRATGERAAGAGRAAAQVELGGQVIQNAQRGRSPPRRSAWRRRRSCCCSRSARVVAAGLPLLLALFGLGIASALISCSRPWSTRRTGPRRWRRCSGSASGSTTRC